MQCNTSMKHTLTYPTNHYDHETEDRCLHCALNASSSGGDFQNRFGCFAVRFGTVSSHAAVLCRSMVGHGWTGIKTLVEPTR